MTQQYNQRAFKKIVGVLPEEVEEENKPIFFWPNVEFSTEFLSMAPQNIRDKHIEHGPFSFKPSPPPDHIRRTFVSKNYSDGGGYEGEVDD